MSACVCVEGSGGGRVVRSMTETDRQIRHRHGRTDTETETEADRQTDRQTETECQT